MEARSWKFGSVFIASLVYSFAAVGAPPAAEPSSEAAIVATVDGEVIKRDEFQAALGRTARQRFYHGSVDEAKLLELKREVIDEMVIERLLLKEAAKRSILPDMAEVEAKVAALDERYKDNPEWKAQRAEVVPEMKARMAVNSQKALLEQAVRAVARPTDAQLKKFYDDNNSLFTEPQQDRVSLILLKVDPASTREVWETAKAEADRIRAKIVAATATFEDLAKLHSGDDSAQNGGDMGYLHHGMLAPEAQEAVDKLKVGELSEPVELLQGYALFKLLDRKTPKLRELEQVRERASELYVRIKGDEAWAALKAGLTNKAKVWVDPSVAAAK